jgi:hypothetical protein
MMKLADKTMKDENGWRPIDRWLPIESAPKDGTLILAYYEAWCAPAYGVIRFCAGSWIDAFDIEWGTPTHWQPLPPPPKR